ncbi:interleukin-11 receptor subunit alpha [Lampris incognitus]|uniref:interleukin-11 receptor subunit alpha n=1 Tax=Lampris incognitus TaxID=2546036 RepID=UPI0024B4FCEB|nr:interleukin-11 receptor subunit alpha [Lampris incognitus]
MASVAAAFGMFSCKTLKKKEKNLKDRWKNLKHQPPLAEAVLRDHVTQLCYYIKRINLLSGVQYGRLETNVTLVCGTSPLRTPVEWRLNRSLVLPWHRLTSDGALVLLHVDQSAQGNYSCHDNDGVLLHTTRLVLGYPPGLLSVSCRVPSHTLVRCSWVESVKTFLPSQYHAFYRGIHQEWMPCVIGPALRSCDITSPSFWQAYHLLNITAANPLGSTPTVKQIRLHELLKPDPPESVLIEEVEGSPTRLVVNWNNPSSWPIQLAFPLKYEVRYRPLGSGHWSQLETSENSVLIVDALAGYLHQVQVRAQDGVNSDSKWSDWTPLLLAMPWRAFTSPEPTAEPFPGELFPENDFPVDTKSETSTTKSQNDTKGEDGNLGLVILLVLFSVVILTIIVSLILTMWVRQKRRDHVTKQELTSMVKMKSLPV